MSVNAHDYTATIAFIDTGASNFISEALALRLDPTRAFFQHSPAIVELGDKTTFETKYIINIYNTLEPLKPSDPLTTIHFTAIVSPKIPYDLIIGNSTVHTWDLYKWLQRANADSLLLPSPKPAPTALARMLRRPPKAIKPKASIAPTVSPAPSTAPSTASITSAFHDANFKRIDGVDFIDPEIDDCPPDTFPPDLVDDLSDYDTDSVISDRSHPDIDPASDDEPTYAPTASYTPLTQANLASFERQHRPGTRVDNDYFDGDSELDKMSFFEQHPNDAKAPTTRLHYARPSPYEPPPVRYAPSSSQARQRPNPFSSDVDDPSSSSDDDEHRDKRQRKMRRKNWSPDDDDAASVASDLFDHDDPSTASPEELAEFETKFKPLLYPHLSASEYDRLYKVLYRLRKRFSDKIDPRGAFVPPMDVNLRRHVEIPKSLRGRARHVATIIDDEIHETVRKLVLLGIVEEIHTAELYSQVLIVRKKTIDSSGNVVVKNRFCIDYRHLNLITDTYNWPLPLIDDLIRSLGGNCVFSTLDLTMGFHQCKLTRKARRLTAFMTSKGMFQYKRVPFGLTGGPAYFQRIVQDYVLKGLVPTRCLVYIDDVIVFGKNHEEHAQNLEAVLQRFKDHNITVKPGKCLFGSPEVAYLGHSIDKDGISISTTRKKHVGEMRMPDTISELHSFVGLANFFRPHVARFAHMTAPLYEHISSKKRGSSKVPWTAASEIAWKTLRQAIVDAPILKFLQQEGDIVLYTDASNLALGGHLVQYVDGQPNTICFVSKKFTDVQSRWSTTEQELFAIVYCVLKLRALLGGRYFTVRTDHKTLTFWHSVNDTPKVYRWKQRLSEFDFDIKHIDGKDNCVADALSRLCIASATNVTKRVDPYASFLESVELSAPTETTARAIPDMDDSSSVASASTTATSTMSTDSAPPDPVTAADRQAIITSFHNDTVGHTSTLQRLRHAGHNWRGITTDVRSHIARCSQCQLVNPNPKPAHGHRFVLTETAPYQRFYVDTMGPRDGDDQFAYIVVFIDGMSRYCRLFPVARVDGPSFARVLEQFLCQVPVAREVFFDNHGQFNNTEVDAVLARHGLPTTADNVNSTPYSHEENGLVERAIGSIQRHYERWRLTHPKDNWRDYLPNVEHIMNSAIIPGTNHTPFELVFGSRAANVAQLQIPDAVQATDKRIDSITAEHDVSLSAHQRSVDDANDKRKLKQFVSGSKILITNPKKTKSFASSRYLGPFTVMRQEGNTVYYADLVQSGIIRSANVSRIKRLDPTYVAPSQNPKTTFFDVERIIGHRFTSHGNLVVRVKWTDQDDHTEENTLQNPSIRRTLPFLQYCTIEHPELSSHAQGIVAFPQA